MSTVLVLRCVDKERKAYGGFVWPESGPVEAPDWDPSPKCGGGLHGWLKGEGDAGASGRDISDGSLLWQVVEVNQEEIVSLDGKVKFPRGVVRFTGARTEAVERIQAKYPAAAVIFGTATAGDYGTATAGDNGKATAGNYGKATAGNYGTATAGYNGTATAGAKGTATAGAKGTATAGDNGVLVLSCWDGNRRRIVVGYVGEDGIEAGKKYRLDSSHKFEAVP